MAPKKIPKTVVASAVDAPPQEVVVEAVNVDTTSQFANIVDGIGKLTLIVKDITLALKGFQKEYVKLSKGVKSRANNGAKRQPSGFAKPALLSDELCNFLALPLGSELARTSVTKQLNVYIKENKLQKEDNKKFIQPDAKLQDLLKIPEGEILSYFNLQKYMKHLFKPTVVVAPVAV
jgi:chromatin remodeling complex protein RSC6